MSDSDVEFISEKRAGPSWKEMPHAYSDCEPSKLLGAYLPCDKCFCFKCGVAASACKNWDYHQYECSESSRARREQMNSGSRFDAEFGAGPSIAPPAPMKRKKPSAESIRAVKNSLMDHSIWESIEASTRSKLSPFIGAVDHSRLSAASHAITHRIVSGGIFQKRKRGKPSWVRVILKKNLTPQEFDNISIARLGIIDDSFVMDNTAAVAKAIMDECK